MTAFALSLKLSLYTTVILIPVGYLIARWLARSNGRMRSIVEALLLLPLLLPPTVIGFYLLLAFSPTSTFGDLLEKLSGVRLVFSFSGLVVASLIVNLPFAVQPILQSLRSIPPALFDAAEVGGMPGWRMLKDIEVPLVWPGILSAVMLTFAHTMGEFGVVLMVGGNIEGLTRTASIAIYDHVQAFEYAAATWMTLGLLGISLTALVIVNLMGHRARSRRGRGLKIGV